MRALPVVDTAQHSPCVRRVPMFSRLTAEQQDLVATFARPRHLRAGDILHRAGDPLGQLFVVHTGTVKVVHSGPSGRTQLVRVVGPGEVVGEHAFLTGGRPDHSVEAATDTELCTFDHRDLARLVAAYPAISIGIMRSLAERLADAERRLALGGVDVPARVASFLLDLPGQVVDGREQVRLSWPKKDIASWLATTPESFSRALARLQQRGLLRVHGETVTILDAAGLEAAASG